jgi:hypothetical protein
MKRNPDHIKLLCEVDGDTDDDIYTHNQVIDFKERDSLDNERKKNKFTGSVASDITRAHCARPLETTMDQPTMYLLDGRAGRLHMSPWIFLPKIIQCHVQSMPSATAY